MSIVIPDERHGERMMPTMDERQMIDAYTEGASAERAGEWFGWSKMQVHRLLDRYQIPLREGYYPGDRPHILDNRALLYEPQRMAWSEQRQRWIERPDRLTRHIARLEAANAADLANGGSCFPPVVVRRAA